jgi:hypothetical protein
MSIAEYILIFPGEIEYGDKNEYATPNTRGTSMAIGIVSFIHK